MTDNWLEPVELRSIADLSDGLNELKRGQETLNPTGLTFDNVSVFDSNGVYVGVVSWASAADSFALEIGSGGEQTAVQQSTSTT